MNAFRNIALSFVCLVSFELNGLAQSSTITGTITTIAGPSLPVSGAQATTQAMDYPSSVSPDRSGGFYVSCPTQNRIYRVAADGTVRVVAGTGSAGFSGDGGSAVLAELSSPQGVAVDAADNVFIADQRNSRVRKVSPDGRITTVAGDGTSGFSGDGGPATSARLTQPTAVELDAAGNLYVVDAQRIRKVSPAGVITTVAGNGTYGFTVAGGPATSAQLEDVHDVAVDAAGNLFIVQSIREEPGIGDAILKVSQAGLLTKVAVGTFYSHPSGVAVDSAGNLFVASGAHIDKVTPGGLITTVAGGTISGFSGDGGPATSAQITPGRVSVDATGALFIADTANHRIRKVTPAGIISTVAGNGTSGFSGDGGPAESARLSYPGAVAFDATGNLFFADTVNRRIRRVTPEGIISTVAGNGTFGFAGDGGPATSAELGIVNGLAVDGSGNLFLADTSNNRVRKVSPAGIIDTFAGDGTCGFGYDGRPATTIQLCSPKGLAVDSAGNLYIAEPGRIRKVSVAGLTTTVAGTGFVWGSGFGGNSVYGPATTVQLSASDVAMDTAGNFLIADAYYNRILKVSPAGLVTIVAGNGTLGTTGESGPATSAQLFAPTRVAVDRAGNLFIADSSNTRIRKVSPSGVITSVVGNGTSGFSGDGGPALSAQLGLPYPYDYGMAVDGAGNLVVTDPSNHRIRKVTFTRQATFSLADRGGLSLKSSGTPGVVNVGYASIQTNAGSNRPAALAILGFRQNNVLVSETGIPATPLIQSGRVYAEINAAVNTGIAIANPNGQPATVTFSFTPLGTHDPAGFGTVTIPANQQIAAFLDQPPFNWNKPNPQTLTFSSSLPIAVTALRTRTNERGEFLTTALPVADSRFTGSGEIVFPHFVDGGGWKTEILLVNPSDSVALKGTLQFLDPMGHVAAVEVNGQANPTSVAYVIPEGSSQRFTISGGSATGLLRGSIRVVPDLNSIAPSGVALFSFRNNGITVSETAIQALPAGTAFRLYAEAADSIQTGIAVANTSANDTTVRFDLSTMDGSFIGLTGTLTIAANGQTAAFLNQIPGLETLQTPFQGVLRVSAPAAIAVAGLRGRYNERGDFLITATTAVNEATPASSSTLFFPHVADSLGYTTQFIVFSVQPGSSSGTIQILSQTGGAWNVTFR